MYDLDVTFGPDDSKWGIREAIPGPRPHYILYRLKTDPVGNAFWEKTGVDDDPQDLLDAVFYSLNEKGE